MVPHDRSALVGPESGDDATLKRIAKGSDAAQHIEAAAKAPLVPVLRVASDFTVGLYVGLPMPPCMAIIGR